MTSRASILILLFLLVSFVASVGADSGIAAGHVHAAQTINGEPAADVPRGLAPDRITGPPQAHIPSALPQAPAKAHDVLKAIQDRNGQPPSGYVGGRTFQNRERRLPRGDYREYDVNPKRAGRNRGAERIVIERRTGKAYYTDDHYRTFIPMN
jgi:ribonuclease T1